MRISHKYKFVFLSNRRCGSNSIRDWLTPHSDVISSRKLPYFNHSTALEMRQHFKQRGWDWDEYFTFTTMRNPWMRVISHYHLALTRKESPWHEIANSFDKFQSFISDKEVQDKFYQQSRIPYDGDSSKLLVDQIYFLETTYHDLPIILRKRNIPVDKTIPHLSHTNHKHYRNYYNESTKNIIQEIYCDDINLGSYKY